MATTIKIRHTPPLTGDPLCSSCKWTGKLKGRKLAEDFTYCNVYEKFMMFHVTECERYHPKSEKTVSEFTAETWIMWEGRFYSPLEVRGLQMKGKWKGPNN